MMSSLLALSAPLNDLSLVLYLSVALFTVGLIGVTCRRNVLIMLLSVEIMLNAANLAFVGFSRLHQNIDGQIMVFFAMVVAAAEVAVGLAIVIAVYRLRQETNVDESRELHDVDYGPVPYPQLEGEDHHHHDDDHHHDHDQGGDHHVEATHDSEHGLGAGDTVDVPTDAEREPASTAVGDAGKES